MRTWEYDKAWSDKFIPTVKEIVGPYLLEPAPLELDRTQATDLIILRAKSITIAVRLRREGYAKRYPGEVTIRLSRSSGSRTEWDKIIDGYADWMFYGHTWEATGHIYPWFLIDLHLFRAALIRYPALRAGMKERSNGDGTRFLAFNVSQFPKEILIAQSWSLAVA